MTTERSRAPLADARNALDQGHWERARELFEAELAEGESAEALEGLGWAGWWLADAELTFDARERAYRAFRARGDAGGAARVAAWIAADHREFRGEDAVGRLAGASAPTARWPTGVGRPRLAGGLGGRLRAQYRR